MNNWHLHITGQVQGVGFRPFVYALAHRLELTGEVKNGMDGVRVYFRASEAEAKKFAYKIREEAPPLAIITDMELKSVPMRHFADFRIVHSSEDGEPELLISPDFGICEDCSKELRHSANRRFDYPYITCTNCGPRYGILSGLPYDREQTSMQAFAMCADCVKEYNDPLDRRYYSQTNSCPHCSISQTLHDRHGALLSEDPVEIKKMIVRAWKQGEIVAIKGTGGYLLTCDLYNADAIQVLRERKARPDKPLALMYGEVNQIDPKATMLAELNSPAAPIVLVPVQPDFPNLELIAPGLSSVGIMRAHNPLFQWLLEAAGHPVVATSGNISGSPICFRDNEAIKTLAPLAELILSDNRDISIPQDDSLVRFSPFREKRILLRRSRGYAPTFIDAGDLPSDHLMAMGALLKSTFSIQKDKRCYISQYLGNLESFDSQQHYEYTQAHLLGLLREKPDTLLCDSHPEYPSSLMAGTLAEKWQIPLYPIQHHQAHFAALLGEHALLHEEEPVLGVIWDGTGLGTDGNIWGGEFFLYSAYSFERIGHLDYSPNISGDKMAREPRLSAFALCRELEGSEALLRNKFSSTEWDIYRKIAAREQALQSSSMGRLFDAVASLLGIIDHQSWEGAAALMLEEKATKWFQNNGIQGTIPYSLNIVNGGIVAYRDLLQEIIRDINSGRDPGEIAARFHLSLVGLIHDFAGMTGAKKIAFSGGVFQNALLADLLSIKMENEYRLYFHNQLSPNDENISYGQIIHHHINQYKQTLTNPKSQQYVFSNSR